MLFGMFYVTGLFRLCCNFWNFSANVVGDISTLDYDLWDTAALHVISFSLHSHGHPYFIQIRETN